MTHSPPIFRIALLIPQDIGYGRGVLQGIQGFARAIGNWRIHRSPPRVDVLERMKRWRPNGVIAHVMDDALAKRLRRLSIPVVNTTSTIQEWPGPLVEADHELIGAIAAEHFLSRGFRNFGYLGSPWAGFSQARERSFRRRIEAAGYAVESCHVDYLPQPSTELPWDHIDRKLLAWLPQLPKPVAVFASNDRPAREIVEACGAAKIRVPDDVAVLGVDNDESECFMSAPSLSSIVNPAEEIGQIAARLMNDLLLGLDPRPMRIAVPPPRLAVRQSSDGYAAEDPHLRLALRLIRQKATEGLTPAAVHREVECSRRLLERRFRDVLGHSVLEEIRRVRLQRASELLADTKLAIGEIARRVGYADTRLLAVAFRRVFNESPSEYRRRLRGD